MDPAFVGLFGFIVGLAFVVLVHTARQFRAGVFLAKGQRFEDPWVEPWSASTGSGSGPPPRRRRKPVADDPALPIGIEDIIARQPTIVCWLKARGVRSVDLEDVTALVIENAWKSRAQWSPKKSSFETWIWAVTRNIANNHFARAYRRRFDIVDPDADVLLSFAAEGTPESALERAEEVRSARAIVAKLPAQAATIFTLYEIDGLPMADVAAELGVVESTAWHRLQRARVLVAALVAKARAVEGRRRGRPQR